MPLSDNNILAKSIRSDFDAIYVTYYFRMFRFAKEYVVFDEDAENIVQDVFLLLWEKREVLDIKVSLLSYLFSLIKNKCLDHLRHRLVVEEYQQEFKAKLSSLESLNYAFNTEEDIEQVLKKAIEALPERCRTIFLKSRLEGKKNREIADELNISVSTVENQITIALKKLKVELKDYLPLFLFLIIVK